MVWVCYGMWDRWCDLTPFRLACKMVLASYQTYVNSFPITSDAPLVITDPAGSNFKCDLGEFTTVLNDGQQFHYVLFPSYVALVKDLDRELVETRHSGQDAPRSTIPGLDATARSTRLPKTGSPARQSRHGGRRS